MIYQKFMNIGPTKLLGYSRLVSQTTNTLKYQCNNSLDNASRGYTGKIIFSFYTLFLIVILLRFITGIYNNSSTVPCRYLFIYISLFNISMSTPQPQCLFIPVKSTTYGVYSSNIRATGL